MGCLFLIIGIVLISEGHGFLGLILILLAFMEDDK